MTSIIATVHRSIPRLIDEAKQWGQTKADKKFIRLRHFRRNKERINRANEETRAKLGYTAAEYKKANYLPRTAHKELKHYRTGPRRKKVTLPKVSI